MLYLSQVLGIPVVDDTGNEIGKVSDLAISTGEMFPRITSVAFLGPDKTPFMVSWRKYVENFDEEQITLNVAAHNIRFSYLQPDELLLARDLMNKQIVDTQGLKVVRVNDLKLSHSYTWLRLLGAEVGIRGLLRGFSPRIEKIVCAIAKAFRHPLEENIIAWNYMELVDRDLSQVKLSVSHKRLHELHPADIADILEQLDPQQRGRVFEHLDGQIVIDTVAELEDEVQSDLIEDMSEHRASELLAQMDPDDAADILGDLPYEKAEALLWLMGVQDQQRIRSLLGFKEKSAGGIMTTDFARATREQTVGETIAMVRTLGEDYESVHYIYVLDDEGRLLGAVSLRELVLATEETKLESIMTTELFTVDPETDQEEVAEAISKYDILAIPVVEESGKMLGIVTIDDALDVLEEEHDEDLRLAGASQVGSDEGVLRVLPRFLRRLTWVFVWLVALLLTFIVPGGSAFLVPTLVVMPVALMIADVVGTYAIGNLIEYDGEELHLGRMLGRDVLLALLVSIVVGLVGFAVISIVDAAWDSGRHIEVIQMWTGWVLPVVASAFLTIIVGTFIAALAMKAHANGKTVREMPISLLLMVIAIAIQVLAVVLINASAWAAF